MRLRAILGLAAMLSGPLAAGDMVVFGDSLSDGGYFLPWGTGRQTNGDLWHEYLADRLGHQRARVGGSFIFPGSSGLSLAVAGAYVINGPFPYGDLADQLSRYRSRRHAWQTGDLCTLWIGGNDLRDNPGQNMTALTTEIGNIITQLANLGIDHFLVPNLPDLGAIPESLGNPTLAAARRAGTISFNNALAAELNTRATTLGVTIDRLDVFGLFNQLLTNPADYRFSNTTGQWKNAPSGSDPDGYVFWDDIHPTTRSHFLLAAAAHVALDPEDAGIEVVSWSISPGGTLRQTWLAHPALTYQIYSGPGPGQLAPAASFLGSPAYTATVPPPGPTAGFFQIRRE